MQCDTGDIHHLNSDAAREMSRNLERVMQMSEQYLADINEMPLVPIEQDEVQKVKKMSKPRRKNWMRNKPCPCKSGKKFKKCCWHKFA